ncbi:MAG: hypothetical protein JWN56_2269 [Sphingobacteriales bacterium]|nr:hypothetical protein [Sphingobacteriales bacterium]
MHSDDESISVAMATFNGADYIREQINSILAQDTKPIEIIIVDDASNDNTVNILQNLALEHSIIKIHINKKNLGHVAVFKQAVSKCKGTYIALSDQDDIWEKNKLSLTLSNLIEIEDDAVPCLVYSDLSMMNSSGYQLRSSFWRYYKLRPHKCRFYSLFFGNMITGCTTLFNRSMAIELLSMPESIPMHDHWMGLIAYGLGKAKALKTPLVRYRCHDKSVTVKKRLNLLMRILALLKELQQHSCYLENHIIQAKIFYVVYGNKMSIFKKKEVQRFIQLGAYNSLTQLIHLKLSR